MGLGNFDVNVGSNSNIKLGKLYDDATSMGTIEFDKVGSVDTSSFSKSNFDSVKSFSTNEVETLDLNSEILNENKNLNFNNKNTSQVTNNNTINNKINSNATNSLNNSSVNYDNNIRNNNTLNFNKTNNNNIVQNSGLNSNNNANNTINFNKGENAQTVLDDKIKDGIKNNNSNSGVTVSNGGNLGSNNSSNSNGSSINLNNNNLNNMANNSDSIDGQINNKDQDTNSLNDNSIDNQGTSNIFGPSIINTDISSNNNISNNEIFNFSNMSPLLSMYGFTEIEINKVKNNEITVEKLFEDAFYDPLKFELRKNIMVASSLQTFNLDVTSLEELNELKNNLISDTNKLVKENRQKNIEQAIFSNIFTRLIGYEDLDSILNSGIIYKYVDSSGNDIYTLNNPTDSVNYNSNTEIKTITYNEFLKDNTLVTDLKNVLSHQKRGRLFREKTDCLIWEGTDEQLAIQEKIFNDNSKELLEQQINANQQLISQYDYIYNQINTEMTYYFDNIDKYIFNDDFDINSGFNLDSIKAFDKIEQNFKSVETYAYNGYGESYLSVTYKPDTKENLVAIASCLINNEGFTDGTKIKVNGVIYDLSFTDDLLQHYTEWCSVMNPEEKKTFNYIYNTQGANAAYEFLVNSQDILDGRWLEKKIQEDQEYAKEHKAWASVSSVFITPFEGMAAVAHSLDARITGEKIRRTDVYSSGDVYRMTVSQEIAKENGEGWAFLYNTGMSIADTSLLIGTSFLTGGSSVAGSAIAKGMTSFLLSTTLMGSRVYVSTLNSALDRGLSDKSAVLLATSSAMTESAMEAISLGNLMNLESRLGNGVLTNVTRIAETIDDPVLANIATKSYYLMMSAVNQGLCEGLEEFETEIANNILDNIINGDLSEYNKKIQNYIELGYTEEEAWHKASAEFSEQLTQAFAGGLVSGMFFGEVKGGNFTYQTSKNISGEILSKYNNNKALAFANELNIISDAATENSNNNLESKIGNKAFETNNEPVSEANPNAEVTEYNEINIDDDNFEPVTEANPNAEVTEYNEINIDDDNFEPVTEVNPNAEVTEYNEINIDDDNFEPVTEVNPNAEVTEYIELQKEFDKEISSLNNDPSGKKKNMLIKKYELHKELIKYAHSQGMIFEDYVESCGKIAQLDPIIQEQINQHAQEVFDKAHKAEKNVSEMMKSLEINGAKLTGFNARFKEIDSIARKIAKNLNGSTDPSYMSFYANQINDSLRYTLILNEKNYITQMFDSLAYLVKHGYEIANVNNSWNNSVYKGLNVTLRSPDNILFELQFHTEASFNTKEFLNHQFYEIHRSNVAEHKITTIAAEIMKINQELYVEPIEDMLKLGNYDIIKHVSDIVSAKTEDTSYKKYFNYDLFVEHYKPKLDSWYAGLTLKQKILFKNYIGEGITKPGNYSAVNAIARDLLINIKKKTVTYFTTTSVNEYPIDIFTAIYLPINYEGKNISTLEEFVDMQYECFNEMNRAIGSMKLDEDTVLYRGINMNAMMCLKDANGNSIGINSGDSIETIFNKIKFAGGEYMDKGFMSSSPVPVGITTTKDIVLVLKCKKGTSGVDLQYLGGHENEFLLTGNQKFDVVDFGQEKLGGQMKNVLYLVSK